MMPAVSTEPLSSRLRAHTRAAHTAAERAGIMVPLLRGSLPAPGYRALLVDLVPLYATLEAALAAPATPPGVRALLLPGLARLPHLRADLDSWRLRLDAGEPETPPSAEASAYAAHLRELARDEPLRLAAHAYVRYLGDLNGGQVLARVISRSRLVMAQISEENFAGVRPGLPAV